MRIKVEIKATFLQFVETQNYVDEFTEVNELGEDDDVDEDALAAFALEQFSLEVDDGDYDFNNAYDVVVESVRPA